MPGKDEAIYVAGHRGMVGAALVRELQGRGYRQVITRSHSELDLQDQAAPRVPSRTKPVVHLHRGGQGGRHPGQQHLSADSSSTATWR